MTKNEEAKRIDERVQNGSVAVLGFGRSNIPLLHLLLQRGARVRVYDQKPFDSLGENAVAAAKAGADFLCGEDAFAEIEGDVIFRSPGIRPDLPALCEQVQKGAILTSEMEYFLASTKARTVGITGSDGKTTTTTLTHLFLSERAKDGARISVGGNIGTPLVDRVDLTARDYAVVELSSFQLQTMRYPPEVAVITNITPNHLNWHRDMAEYTEAKTHILREGYTRRLVVNAENNATRQIGEAFSGEVIFFSSSLSDPAILTAGHPNRAVIYEKDGVLTFFGGNDRKAIPLFPVRSILLPGKHNEENVMAAIGATWGEVSIPFIEQTVKTFGGVEHRLELVRSLRGVKYINSSIDSSPTRTCAALSALTEKPVVICGGRDKHVPFDPLAVALRDRAAGVVLTGEARGQIREALSRTEGVGQSGLAIEEEADFDAAVAKAEAMTRRLGCGVLLLSPACTSFDAFANFEERGKRFKELIGRLTD